MLNDLRTNPFYRPLWRRVAICAATIAWAIFEFMGGSGFWLVFAGGSAVFCVWALLLTYPKADA
jgi:hypothetical protein